MTILLCLLSLLAHDDWIVRQATQSILLDINNTSDIRALLSCVRKQDGLERFERCRWIMRQYGPVVPRCGYWPCFDYVEMVHPIESHLEEARSFYRLNTIDFARDYQSKEVRAHNHQVNRLAGKVVADTLIRLGYSRTQVSDIMERALQKEKDLGVAP